MSKLNKVYVAECISTMIKESEEKKRKFVETVELQIGLKNYDPAKDKRFTGTVRLKNAPKHNIKVCIFADALHMDEAKSIGIDAMDVDDLKKLNKEKKLIKKIVQKYDAFLVTDVVLKLLPKILGSHLGMFTKMGKFPLVTTHHDRISAKIDELKATIKFQMKKTLCLGVPIAHLGMSEEQITQNVYQSINFLISLLKKNWQNIRSLHLKTTMGKPQRLY